jgi:glutamate N-acetyltransferase/amino-acid N-acetyltransferase
MRRYSFGVDRATVSDAASYHAYLDRSHSIPAGFSLFRTSCRFVPEERPDQDPTSMNIAMIHNDGPRSDVAGVTTGNRFPGAPVVLARRRLESGGFRSVLVNNRIANVATRNGVEDAIAVARAAADAFGVDHDRVLPASTGVIGWRLPVDAMIGAVAALPDHRCSPREFAEAIMTTDRYPKVESRTVGEATILGFAKGAGMIEPAMATMLAFIVTDAVIPEEVSRPILRRSVERSFNRISVDGDESTSDMVLLIANGASKRTVDPDQFESSLDHLCGVLAREIVRNGEGTSHIIEATVRGVPTTAIADRLARAVVNSPLVKTAIYGNDPNIGRIVGALGSELARLDDDRVATDRLRIAIGERTVYAEGAFRLDGALESALSAYLKDASFDETATGYPLYRDPVTIEVDFACGEADATVIGSDLSHQYIVENADYRT